MIAINNLNIISIYCGSSAIVSVKYGVHHIWPDSEPSPVDSLSCFANGYWIDENPWTDDLPWKDQ